MAVVNISRQEESGETFIDKQRRTRITVAAGNTSTPVLVHRFPVSATVKAGAAGTAKVQFTTQIQALILADGSGANWEDSPEGAVLGPKTSVFANPITAVRVVDVSGPGPSELNVVQ